MFLMKIVQKKGKKSRKKNNKKSRKIRERKKNEAKWKQSKKSIKEFFQGNYEEKRVIQSFKPRQEILKLKIKIKNIQ